MITEEKKFGHYILTPSSELFCDAIDDDLEELRAYQQELLDFKKRNAIVRPPCAIPPVWTPLKLIAIHPYNHNTK